MADLSDEIDFNPVVEALYNELVLEKVFKNLSAKDLSSVRLVCPLWRQVSIPMWHAAARLNVTTVVIACGGGCCCKCCCKCSPYLSLGPGPELAVNKGLNGPLKRNPFRSLSVDLVCLEHDEKTDVKLRTRLSMLTFNTNLCQKTLWQGASRLTRLTLLNQYFDTCNDFVKVVTKWLPQLQSLSVINAVFGYICESDKEGEWVDGVDKHHTKLTKMEITMCDKPQCRYGQHTLGWKYFIQSFPNLTSLKISSNRLKGIGVDVLEDIENLRATYKNSWNLREFLILGNATETTHKSAQLFKRLELPLEHVSLDLNDDTSVTYIASIFASCAPTLQTLSVSATTEFCRLSKILTVLPLVTKLNFRYAGASPTNFKVILTNLSSCFPALRDFSLETFGCIEDTREVIKEIWPNVPNVSVEKWEEPKDKIQKTHFGVMTGTASVRTSILSCVACVRIPPNRIFQCHMGHLVCQECTASGHLGECPKCQTEYGTHDIKALSAETMMTFSKFKCPFNEEGCTEVKCRRQNHGHISTCNYRAIRLSKVLGYNSAFQGLNQRPLEYHGPTTTRDFGLSTDKQVFLRNFNQQLKWKWANLLTYKASAIIDMA